MRTITQLEVLPERLYRPFVVPGSEDELQGPATGMIGLPRRIAWNIDPFFDIDDPRQAVAAYDRLLSDGTEDDIREFVNTTVLQRIWPQLHISAIVRKYWAEALPKLDAVSRPV
jgi:hypothetical protein